jgi:polysaccharide export outer membrane protein
VEAKGKTITQLISFLKSALLNILNQPVISIKLVNRYVSILGEVRNPGHFVYTEDKLSIFDAIGMAGDITDYGNRKQVLLIRNQDNVNIRKEINLLKSNILSSDYYFLRPGDIVYVKPMHNKFWGMRQFPFAIVLSSVTTAILVLNYIGY